jgi:membrane protein DedA with SNARE-associated domain
MTFLLIAIGSFLGTLLGNLGLFYIIGMVAQRKEKKQLEELQKMQQGYLEMVQRERARLEKYAQMEG